MHIIGPTGICSRAISIKNICSDFLINSVRLYCLPSFDGLLVGPFKKVCSRLYNHLEFCQFFPELISTGFHVVAGLVLFLDGLFERALLSVQLFLGGFHLLLEHTDHIVELVALGNEVFLLLHHRAERLGVVHGSGNLLHVQLLRGQIQVDLEKRHHQNGSKMAALLGLGRGGPGIGTTA